MTTLAQQTLTVISKQFFGGRNYNDACWYEAGTQDKNGSISGTVYKTVERGKSKEIGIFTIQASGYISKFPTISEEFIAGLNKDKEGPKVKNKTIVPPILPDTPESKKIVSEIEITEANVNMKKGTITPKTRRGRPKKSSKDV